MFVFLPLLAKKASVRIVWPAVRLKERSCSFLLLLICFLSSSKLLFLRPVDALQCTVYTVPTNSNCIACYPYIVHGRRACSAKVCCIEPNHILEEHSSIPLTPTGTQSVCSPLWQSKTCNTALFNCEVNIYCPESTLCWTIANLGRSRLMQHWIVTSLHCFDTMIVSALDICNVTILSSHLSIFITALPPADVIYLVQCPRFCQW